MLIRDQNLCVSFIYGKEQIFWTECSENIDVYLTTEKHCVSDYPAWFWNTNSTNYTLFNYLFISYSGANNSLNLHRDRSLELDKGPSNSNSTICSIPTSVLYNGSCLIAKALAVLAIIVSVLQFVEYYRIFCCQFSIHFYYLWSGQMGTFDGFFWFILQ